MTTNYDISFFDLDYCQVDVSKIVEAIRSRSSLLAIGMPGCGKSRLINFIFNRPDVLQHYGLPHDLKTIRVDGDLITHDEAGVYAEMLRLLSPELESPISDNLSLLKNRVLTEVQKLETNIELIVIFDNFVRQLQQALSEDFYRFLFGLRNARSQLNISYIFMANLNIELSEFQRVERLFDKGVDRSICWLSLLNKEDTFASIKRQLYKINATPGSLDDSQERIYELSGGHALLNRYVTHLMLGREILRETRPDGILNHQGIKNACQAIWDDLKSEHQNYLIDLSRHEKMSEPESLLINYGVLSKDNAVFSPLFAAFMAQQKKVNEVTRLSCNELQTKLILETLSGDVLFPLERLSAKKVGLLSQKFRSLLCFLVSNQNQLCRKDKLVEVGWPEESEHGRGVYDQALSRQIDRIRAWLRQQEQLNNYIEIETVRSEGYRLITKF
ncbi:MAG: helix-turn-helix domain-containing protein [Anaerolineae bacterium]|nr:helix-turn-helix domain-containing protein [Anaerolineae bacterium]